MKREPWLLLTSLAFFASSSSLSQKSVYQGKCVGVHDGDTITVLVDSRQIKVRLEGIDAPELGQDFSQRSKRFLSNLVFGKEIVVKEHSIDRHGRTVGRVYVDDRNVSPEMAAAGMAWHFKKYSSDTILARLEEAARMGKIGIWSIANPIPPWDYRAGITTASSSKSSSVDKSNFISSAETVYITRTGKKYHRSSCSSLSKSKIPISLEDACKRGFEPCSR